MEEVDLAYAAGLMDGEGTVTLMRVRKSAKYKAPVVSMTSTDRPLLIWLKDQFGGHVRTQKRYADHHKQAWVWHARYSAALNFLSQVRPWLRVPEKCRRADLLLQEYPRLTPRNGKYTSEMRTQKLAFEDRFFHPSAP